MKRLREFLRQVDWMNAAFLSLTPIVGIGGTVYLVSMGHLDGRTLALAGVLMVVTGLAVTGGYHRLFSHRSYEASPIVRGFFLLFGAATFENSALRWASDHRAHHRYTDTDRDPYNIKRGFWYAHMGWVCLKSGPGFDIENVRDLDRDPLVRFQHRFYFPISIGMGLVFPMAFAALWGDWLGGLIVAGVLRVVLVHHFTFFINSFAHIFGRQPYSDHTTARDSWWLAYLTYGEGYHNYHHSFPSDYRNGVRPHHWDPTKWTIQGLARMGLVSKLRQVPEEAILRARLMMDQKRVVERLSTHPTPAPVSLELVESVRLKIERAYIQFRAHRRELHRMKTEGLVRIEKPFHEKRAAIRAQRRLARRQLESALTEWATICRTFRVQPTRSAQI